MVTSRCLIATAVVCLASGAPATAQQPAPPVQQTGPIASSVGPRRTMTALRMDPGARIVLDGVLDEEVWRRAVPASDFIQQDPDNGTPATEPTEVRIIFNEHSLYMGVTCFDSEPGKWLGYQRRRDEFLQADDRFMWNIDTYNNQQSGYFFEMNPSGLMGDALRGATFQNRQWDGIWNAKVRHSGIGWTLEIEIPFATLNFDPQADAWGINFQRTVRRKNEESLWSGWGRNQGLNRLSNAGLLMGLRDVHVGHGLDLKPYGVATNDAFPGRDIPSRSRVSAGLDLFYSPTPRVRTNLTLNTDFAQTEVDQRLTNLTRFPQFFPEKRDFFLDGSTFFDFQSTAQSGNSLMPFFTRRIGLDADGNPQPIDIGGKLAGQFGSTDVGALYVRTRREGDVLGEDFAVIRAKQRVFRQSYVGMMYTGRSARDSTRSSHTLGADFVLSTSSFMGAEQLSVGGFFVDTSSPARTGKSAAYGLTIDYPNDPWAGLFLYREIQQNYDAAVGFTPRRGFRWIQPSTSYTRRPGSHRFIRTISHAVDGSVILDTGALGVLDRSLDITAISIGLHSGDFFQVHVMPAYEKLEANFTLPGITLPQGQSYTYTRYSVGFTTAQRRKLAFGPTVEMGQFYNGTRARFAATLNVRLRPGVIVYTSGEWNSVHLDEGRFHTRLFRVVPELQFSPWISWVNNIQFDTQSAVLGWQSRFRWILKPGNDLYVVYTHNWLDDPLRPRFATLDRRAATKALYTHRF
jgi:hypothetical protein